MNLGDTVQFTAIPPKRVIRPDLVGKWAVIISSTKRLHSIKFEDGSGVVRQISERFLRLKDTPLSKPTPPPGIIERTDKEQLEAIRQALKDLPFRPNRAVQEARALLHKQRAQILQNTKLKDL